MNTSPHLPAPKTPRPLFSQSGRITFTILAIVILALLAYLHGPTSGQIRLDTGDLRYCWFGIPLSYKPMPEPYRSKLLTLAAKSPPIRPTWVTCVTYPLPTTNNSDLMCSGFYAKTSAWLDEDPRIARWILDDVVKYLLDTHARHGLPESTPLLFDVQHNSTGIYKVDPDWRNDDQIKDYLTTHHYIPLPKPAPATWFSPIPSQQ